MAASTIIFFIFFTQNYFEKVLENIRVSVTVPSTKKNLLHDVLGDTISQRQHTPVR
jgi:hypothetical protein